MTKLVSYYLKDTSGSETYCRKRNNDEYYIETDDPERIYALNQKKQKRYARDNRGKEVYAEINNDPIVIRDETGTPIYAKNDSQSEYYPTKDNKDVVYFDRNDEAIYARNEKGKPFYPRDNKRNEFVVKNFWLTNDDDTKLVQPVDANGNPILHAHQSDEDALEVRYPFQIDTDGNEIYPKDANGDEFYPNGIAFSKNIIPLYAHNKNGEIIFDKNSRGDEIYLCHPDDLTDVITTSDGLHLPRYARTVDGEEQYPKSTVKLTPFRQMDVILNNRYAVTSRNEPKYPLDMNGNEYTLDPLENDESKVFPIGYPVTNEGKVIVPNVNDRPYIKKEIEPPVSLDDIVGLIRPNWPWNSNDYLTNIDAKRSSRSPRQFPFQVKPINLVQKRSSNPNKPLPKNSGFGLWQIILCLLVGLAILSIIILKCAFENKLVNYKEQPIK